MATEVRIARAQFGSSFQLIRAMLLASSACLPAEPVRALDFLDYMEVEIRALRKAIKSKAH